MNSLTFYLNLLTSKQDGIFLLSYEKLQADSSIRYKVRGFGFLYTLDQKNNKKKSVQS